MENNSTITQARDNIHKLILNRNAQEMIHGSGAVGKLNKFIAIKITKIVGSMWCAYVFCLISIISLPAAIASHNPIIIISWVAQTFLQLVLLPIIIVGQNVQAAASDERAKHDHYTLNAIHTLTAEIYKINEQHTKILDLLEKNKN
jgi:hypothetical protein